MLLYVWSDSINCSHRFFLQFDFDDYLRRLYLLGNVTLIDTDWITINEPEFFRHVSLILSQQSSRTIQNYFIWRFLMNHAKNMPKKYRDIKQIFIQAFQGIITEPSRNTTCAIYVNENMGLAVSKLYIRKYFDANARNQVIERLICSLVFLYYWWRSLWKWSSIFERLLWRWLINRHGWIRNRKSRQLIK